MSDSPAALQSQSDREFCWELILRTRPNFSSSCLYTARETSARLVALYALFSSLEELFCRVTDEQVAQAKLVWWKTQLLGKEYTTSDHPVTRHLRQTEAITSASIGYVQNLLNSTGQRMDHGSVADETGLKELCVVVALDQMKLELSLDGAIPISPWAIENACAVVGLVQLLRESSRGVAPTYSWVPLTVLAQLGVNRSELAQNRDSEAVRKLISRLCAMGLNWLPAGSDVCKRPLLAPSLPGTTAARHWLIQLRLCVRLLQKLPGKTTSGASRIFSRTTAGDVWCAWRCARTLAR